MLSLRSGATDIIIFILSLRAGISPLKKDNSVYGGTACKSLCQTQCRQKLIEIVIDIRLREMNILARLGRTNKLRAGAAIYSPV